MCLKGVLWCQRRGHVQNGSLWLEEFLVYALDEFYIWCQHVVFPHFLCVHSSPFPGSQYTFAFILEMYILLICVNMKSKLFSLDDESDLPNIQRLDMFFLLYFHLIFISVVIRTDLAYSGFPFPVGDYFFFSFFLLIWNIQSVREPARNFSKTEKK